VDGCNSARQRCTLLSAVLATMRLVDSLSVRSCNSIGRCTALVSTMDMPDSDAIDVFQSVRLIDQWDCHGVIHDWRSKFFALPRVLNCS
jgi:hypothetical protein